MQQFAYTSGKNATDSAMIIDAMDLLYSKSIDIFALMTSDSDFTPLVMRLLESGFPVYGFGDKKTPKPFVDSCSTFIYTNSLTHIEESTHNTQQPTATCKSKLRQDTNLVRLLRNAVEQTSGDDDWANLSRVGKYASNNSSFSPVNYGYKKLGDLIKATDLFKITMRNDGSSMYIKDKRKKEN